jgi:hypothetical protein
MSSSINTPYTASRCRLNGCMTALQCSGSHSRKSYPRYEKCARIRNGTIVPNWTVCRTSTRPSAENRHARADGVNSYVRDGKWSSRSVTSCTHAVCPQVLTCLRPNRVASETLRAVESHPQAQLAKWVMASSWRRLHASPRTRRGTSGGANGYRQRLTDLVSQRCPTSSPGRRAVMDRCV